MAIATTTEAIKVAEKMLVRIDGEMTRVRQYVEASPRLRRALDAHASAELLARWRADGEAIKKWRHEGRQTMAMHPELVDEIRLSTSDKLYREALRALPYINPLVVFPAGDQVMVGWKSGAQERHRLLGFFTYGLSSHPQTHPSLILQENHLDWMVNTSDPDATYIVILLISEVINEIGEVIDIEVASISIPFDEEPMTLKEMVTDGVQRYAWNDSVDPVAAEKWYAQVLKVCLGSLFYLASTVTDVERVPAKVVAKRSNKAISRKPMSMYQVGWTIGASLSKARAQRRASLSPSQQSDLTHQQDPQHRKAHFKMQPYGPGNSLRRYTYISPYWTHRERLGIQGLNTARRVI